MLHRLHAAALAVLLAVSPAESFASQNALSSPTTGTVSGLQLTNNYNNALDSLNTCNSGTSAPTNQLSGSPSIGNCWLNTTAIPYPVGYYDGANWLSAFWLDATNHHTDVKIGGGTASAVSAATVDLCATAVAPDAYVTITGTTTITSFGSTCNAGHIKVITFAGALLLTYNATSLIIPGAASVTTAAGDQAIVVSLGSGNWQVISYIPASGQALINPAVPVGTVLPYGGYAIPANYAEGFGQTVSRTTFANLMTAFTSVQSVTRTNGSPTLTGFTDTTRFGKGQCVEGAGIPNTGSCTSSILSVTATTVTLNQNATSSGTANVTVFFYGNGDGSTTFGVLDCRGKSPSFRDNIGGNAANIAQVSTNMTTTASSTAATVSSATGLAAGMTVINPNVTAGTTISAIAGTSITLSAAANSNGTNVASRFSSTTDAQMMGSTGGAEVHALTAAEMASISYAGSTVSSLQFSSSSTNFEFIGLGSGSTAGFCTGGANCNPNGSVQNGSSVGGGVSVVSSAGNEPHLVQNPTLVLTCIVRVSRLDHAPVPPRHLAANDNSVMCPRARWA